MCETRSEFIGDRVTGTASPRAIGTAALDHEIRYHPMKNQVVVVSFLREVYEVARGYGCFVHVHLCCDRSVACLDRDRWVGHEFSVCVVL